MVQKIYIIALFLSAFLPLFIIKRKGLKDAFLYLCLLGGWPGLHWLATRWKWMCGIQLLFGISIALKAGNCPTWILWAYFIFSLIPAIMGGREIKLQGCCLCMTAISYCLYAKGLFITV